MALILFFFLFCVTACRLLSTPQLDALVLALRRALAERHVFNSDQDTLSQAALLEGFALPEQEMDDAASAATASSLAGRGLHRICLSLLLFARDRLCVGSRWFVRIFNFVLFVAFSLFCVCTDARDRRPSARSLAAQFGARAQRYAIKHDSLFLIRPFRVCCSVSRKCRRLCNLYRKAHWPLPLQCHSGCGSFGRIICVS